MGEAAIQYIPVDGKPLHLKTVEEVEAALNVRIAEEFLQKRKGDGGKYYTYVPWEKTLEVLNTIFGAFGWGNNEPLSYYVEDGKTYVVVTSITISAYDPGAGCIVLVTKTNQGRATVGNSHDTAAAAGPSDGISRVAKLLGDALGAFLYDPNDPAHQTEAPRAANPTTQQRTGSGVTRTATQPSGTQRSGTTNGKWQYAARRGGPTEKMAYSLHMKGFSDDVIDRVTFDDTRAILDYWNNEGKPTVNGALEKAGLLATAGVGAEDHYLDSGADDFDEIDF